MRRLIVLACWALATALAGAASARADRYDEQIPPKPERYVTDRADILGVGGAEALNAKLEQFERDTSNQVLVWIDRKIPEGFTLEDFTVRAGQKWGAGQKQEDNGAILFIFPDDRKMRLEVGYGLEGVLPDALARRILDEEIAPRFRAGDFPGGVNAGVDAIMAAIRGEYKGTGTTVDERRRGSGRPAEASTCVMAALFFGVFILLPILMRKKRAFRTHGGRGWWSSGGWGGWGGGGWGGGGFGGGGWGGGGGGFSGGGGSFGGGGASGSW